MIYKHLFFQKIKFSRKLKSTISGNTAIEKCLLGENIQNLDPNYQKFDPAFVSDCKRIGNLELPSKIVKRIKNIIDNSHKPSIRSSAMKMYASLRNPTQKMKNKLSEANVNAYISGIMPQVYASLYSVINELRIRVGNDWVPETVLDCGTGPGTGALVFQELFSDSIEKVKNIVVVEPTYIMRKRAFYIHNGNKSKIVSNISSTINSKFDFIIANHTILDINTSDYVFSAHIKKLWNKLSPKNGILLLLERGNPIGYKAIVRARQVILSSFDFTSKGSEVMNVGYVISPCPHDKECPLFLNNHFSNHKKWCHFSQKLIRPIYLQKTKHSAYNIEDVKYSYCIIRKGVSRPIINETKPNFCNDHLFCNSYNLSRLILPPLKKRGHVIMDACTFNGTIERLIVPKSQGKIYYRNARKARWGDLLALGSKISFKRNINIQK
ncbi:hypothetical protein PCK1_002366 [Pneumocystis canis]|nr:hypothetical protein PCK1_002366 [Pneumocystis canis]